MRIIYICNMMFRSDPAVFFSGNINSLHALDAACVFFNAFDSFVAKQWTTNEMFGSRIQNHILNFLFDGFSGTVAFAPDGSRKAELIEADVLNLQTHEIGEDLLERCGPINLTYAEKKDNVAASICQYATGVFPFKWVRVDPTKSSDIEWPDGKAVFADAYEQCLEGTYWKGFAPLRADIPLSVAAGPPQNFSAAHLENESNKFCVLCQSG